MVEYCSSVWMSAAASHLRIFDRLVSKAVTLSGNRDYALEAALFDVCVPARLTSLTDFVLNRYLDVTRSRTVQCSRLFIPACARYLNPLD